MTRFKLPSALFAFTIFVLSLTSNAAGSCNGSSPTWTSSPDLSSVNTCIGNAQTGDTINVTNGSASWSGADFTKAVTLSGGHGGTTTISGNFTITNAAMRLTGFTFNVASDNGITVEWSVGWRIDHNIINHPLPSGVTLLTYGGFPGTTASEGLIDNNTITNGKIVYFGSTNNSGSTGLGIDRWSEPLNEGTSHAVYIEDNTFNLTDTNSYNNSIDCHYGSRIVARFNTFHNGRIEQHGIQSDGERSCMLWEFYNNSMTNPNWQNYRPYFIRGGTGMVFHNTTDGTFLHEEIDIDNPRSSESSIAGQISNWGFCGCNSSSCTTSGSHFLDGNTPGQAGRVCRDQIGTGGDASEWLSFGNPAPSQKAVPAYFWRNTNPSGELPVNVQCPEGVGNMCSNQDTQIQESRDYYTYRSSFNGTAGVGEGTLAARPATCTTGVGYWVTDQGSWNTKLSPNTSGQLYKCTSTNTWTLYYTPYTYPYPQAGGTGGGGGAPAPPAPPAPPTNLQGIVH